MSKIHDNSIGYSLLRIIADACIHHSFRKYTVVGMENIPKSGAIIYAPNHCDALMDPLAALALTWDKKVFVARADVFSNPVVQKILTFLKIMPINRKRDGIRSVIKTEETIKNSIEVLNNKVNFCIMPEGMHRSMHSLLPIGKGIARIACGACPGLGDTPLYIVPIGLEYGDYYRYRSTLLLQVGEAINVTEYLKANADKSEHNRMQEIREMVSEGIRSKILYIKDDEAYEGTWELAKVASGHVHRYNLEGRLKANRDAVSRIEALRQSDPEGATALFDKAKAFAQARKEAKVSIDATHRDKRLRSAILLTLKVLVFLPVFVASIAVSFPQIIACEKLSGSFKDRAFRNSVRCGLMIFLWSFLILVWAIVLFCTMPWYMAVFALAFIVPTPFHCYDYFGSVRQCASAWRYLFNGKLLKMRNELREEMKKYNII